MSPLLFKLQITHLFCRKLKELKRKNYERKILTAQKPEKQFCGVKLNVTWSFLFVLFITVYFLSTKVNCTNTKTRTNNTSKLYRYEFLSLMTKSGFLVGLRGLSLKLGGDKKLMINLGIIKFKKKNYQEFSKLPRNL